MALSTPLNKLITCLWYDNQAEEAAAFYVDTFNNAPSVARGDVPKSEIQTTNRYPEYQPASGQVPKYKPGSVMTVAFRLAEANFVALNGGPIFSFTPAISMQILCDGQEEIDYFWEKLVASGGKEEYCGWCTDRYGVSWQVVPKRLAEAALDSSDQTKFINTHKRMMETMPKKLIEKDLFSGAEGSS